MVQSNRRTHVSLPGKKNKKKVNSYSQNGLKNVPKSASSKGPYANDPYAVTVPGDHDKDFDVIDNATPRSGPPRRDSKRNKKSKRDNKMKSKKEQRSPRAAPAPEQHFAQPPKTSKVQFHPSAPYQSPHGAAAVVYSGQRSAVQPPPSPTTTSHGYYSVREDTETIADLRRKPLTKGGFYTRVNPDRQPPPVALDENPLTNDSQRDFLPHQRGREHYSQGG